MRKAVCVVAALAVACSALALGEQGSGRRSSRRLAYCTECGVGVASSGVYCTSCGTRVPGRRSLVAWTKGPAAPRAWHPPRAVARFANLTRSEPDDFGPSVDPRSGRIAFSTSRDGNEEIYVMSPDGLTHRRLTFHAASDTAPAFSPNGLAIAFVSDRTGANEIYVMRAAGGLARQVTSGSGVLGTPAWTHDGQAIVFTMRRGSNREIAVVGIRSFLGALR